MQKGRTLTWNLGRCVDVRTGARNGWHISRKVGPCPRTQRRWVLNSVQAVLRAVNDVNTHRPRFQVKPRPSYTPPLVFGSFDSDRLGEVSWLVNVTLPHVGDVVRHELKIERQGHIQGGSQRKLLVRIQRRRTHIYTYLYIYTHTRTHTHI